MSRCAVSCEHLASFAHFDDVLQIFVSFGKDRAGTGGAVHFADVAFADHCVEDGGGTAVADA